MTTTTRRAILAGLAATPVAAMPEIVKAAPAGELIKAEAPATAEECAAVDFEPFPADVLATIAPPSDERWAEISLEHLIFLRLALGVLRQSKPEVIDKLRKIDDETADMLFDGLKAAVEFHEQAADLLKKAELRLIVAGSVLETTEWAQS